jgi:hypothetical protein
MLRNLSSHNSPKLSPPLPHPPPTRIALANMTPTRKLAEGKSYPNSKYQVAWNHQLHKVIKKMYNCTEVKWANSVKLAFPLL